MMNEIQKERIRRLRRQGYGYRTIAKKTGYNVNSIKSYCTRNGLGGVAKDRVKEIDYKDAARTVCRNCGAEIIQTPKRKPKSFCCEKCRNEWWNSHLEMVNKKAWYTFTCQNCGKEFKAYGQAQRKYCCHECYLKDRFGNK